ncbi:hypothetical protein ACROYT_G031571 [Oculina patagonica]
MQSRRDKEKGMRKTKSAIIVEERVIWQGTGTAQRRERNVQNVEGMVILLCVVRERVIVMEAKVKQISDVRITMLTEEDCAFTFAVTENREETCNVISSKEPVVEVSVSGITTRVLIDSGYPKVFVGVGKRKDYQLKLNVDPDVTPIAQKPWRVPFALREKVTAKVEDLIAKDIVERDIRLCVDMRKANAAIIRERIPIPTVYEVLENLNGSTVFSKLDLRLGFHKIELDEGSDDGLFRYKRLSFGVNSAPEKYQQIVTQVISDVGGVQNIADDLIVHGKNDREHDRNLNRLMQRLEEKNLTLNAEKCQFQMDKVVFMGLLVSKYGIGSH